MNHGTRGIMVRELVAAYPGNSKFHDFVYGLSDAVLCQLYGDIVMRGAELVQTAYQWELVPYKMGWDAPNFCR